MKVKNWIRSEYLRESSIAGITYDLDWEPDSKTDFYCLIFGQAGAIGLSKVCDIFDYSRGYCE